MTKVLITESYLEDIADSIRAKNGTQNTYKPSEMSGAIDAISGGGITPTGTKEISITQNGITTEDVTSYANAEINVAVSTPSPTLQTKTVTPSESTQNVSADNGYDGLSQVTVNPIPSGYVQPSGSLSITTNDTYDVSQYASAVVNVSGGGGSGITKTTGIVTGNGTNTIAIPTAKSPDVAYVYRSDIDNMTAVAGRTNAASLYWNGGIGTSTYCSENSTNLANGGTKKNSGTESGSTPSGTNIASYDGEKFYLKSGNNSNLWSSSLTYVYVFIFFS